MRNSERGFTLIEMLLVFVIMGIVLTLAAPKLGRASGQMAVRNARNEVSAMISLSRALAIQNGRRANFRQDGAIVLVTLENGIGGNLDTMALRDMGAKYGVLVGPSALLNVPFDPRGFTNGSTTPRTIAISRDGFADTVCVIGLGKISTDRCSP
ncbi:MAG TPA: prepilin-type N-terminal cleavage/methylation domain-containing protein [Gemmatimonadaceae bacterium]|jgi:general secretion pathway protein H